MDVALGYFAFAGEYSHPILSTFTYHLYLPSLASLSLGRRGFSLPRFDRTRIGRQQANSHNCLGGEEELPSKKEIFQRQFSVRF